MRTIKEYPSQAELKDYFEYHSDGYFIWKKKTNGKVVIGKKAGRSKVDLNGYSCIWFGNKEYKLHRCIYIYHYGIIPEGYIVDHINPVKSSNDNRIENLQLLNRKQNVQRKVIDYKMRHTTSNYRGVVYRHKRKSFQAQIGVNGRTIFLGMFKSEDEAAIAYDQAAMIYFGRFATLNFNNQIIDIVNKNLGPIRI